MLDPDKDLVKKAQKGDKNAYGELVNRYYEMVYAISYGVLRNREASLDSAQNVFMKVYKEIVKFEGKSKFKSWLYRVAMNAALDEVRKKKRPMETIDMTDSNRDEESRAYIIPDKGEGPRDSAARHELRAVLDKAINELSPDHRSVLVLREWQGLSYEEIAETLNVELGTVMSRLHYARKKLAEILQPDVY